jgi:hypothetical protein
MYWFDIFNNCEVLLAALVEAAHRCSETFFGRDLPAFRPDDATVRCTLNSNC